jgi:hypothetical protein
LPAYEHLPESRTAMEELTPGEWNDLNAYRARYNQEQQARQALDMLAASKDSPSYGFRVNNYRHCPAVCNDAVSGWSRRRNNCLWVVP